MAGIICSGTPGNHAYLVTPGEEKTPALYIDQLSAIHYSLWKQNSRSDDQANTDDSTSSSSNTVMLQNLPDPFLKSNTSHCSIPPESNTFSSEMGGHQDANETASTCAGLGTIAALCIAEEIPPVEREEEQQGSPVNERNQELLPSTAPLRKIDSPIRPTGVTPENRITNKLSQIEKTMKAMISTHRDFNRSHFEHELNKRRLDYGIALLTKWKKERNELFLQQSKINTPKKETPQLKSPPWYSRIFHHAIAPEDNSANSSSLENLEADIKNLHKKCHHMSKVIKTDSEITKELQADLTRIQKLLSYEKESIINALLEDPDTCNHINTFLADYDRKLEDIENRYLYPSEQNPPLGPPEESPEESPRIFPENLFPPPLDQLPSEASSQNAPRPSFHDPLDHGPPEEPPEDSLKLYSTSPFNH